MLRIGSVQHNIHIGEQESDNENRKIQIGPSQFGEIQVGKYNSRHANREIQNGECNSGTSNLEYKSESTIRKNNRKGNAKPNINIGT